MPPHRAKEGFLLKLSEGERRNVAEGASNMLQPEQKEHYSAEDRIKLLFQADGFFHFLSENPSKTLCARNAAGEISGLGILRGRLSKDAGATIFVIVAWGLSEFEECTDLTGSDKLYGTDCAMCHGSDGHTLTDNGRWMYPRASDLTSRAVRRYSDRELFWIVKNGIRLSGTPAFGKVESDEHIWNLVHYVRTLKGSDHPESAGDTH